MPTETKTKLQIRWMIRRELPRILTIDAESYLQPWDQEDFLNCLRERNCIGMVAATETGVIAGYMIYEIHKTKLEMVRFAVHPEMRRQGIGRAMLAKLAMKLSQQRTQLLVSCHERNLTAQKFMRACGMQAVAVNREAYLDGDSEYVFVLSVE